LQLKRRSKLRFVFISLIAGSEIAAVGRADLRHVIIVLPPASSPLRRAACDVSTFPSTFYVCDSSSAPLTKNIVADTQRPRYTVAPLDPRA
jgi:hypothetical protein